MNIVLIGYRCTGKTIVGKGLAQRLNLDFIDVDEYIERKAGSSIKDIVSRSGWDEFRRLEKEAIKRLSSMDRKVIAAGGGVVLDTHNVGNLKKNGVVILLEASTQTILHRMRSDKKTEGQRPGLTGKDPYGEIEEVLKARRPFYKSAMDFSIDTTSKDVESIVNEIINQLETKGD
ncbi:MAG TPA: shikimate kinase [Syntrophaceae bacterium]|nr:shikimate kinase [Syntrophaceae bacterium]